ncbi:hypothetical protein DAPK24_031420 [Pichia kluyveri]|uniref:Mso1 N-terminal domain-containing protein n=1 Tax=Pichia kluyveri TaxID=36015 RepID=A0AAV5R6E1_PICKL|nr:hypothetical protein DAPK24_031420 [Pichia kluyveri]
MSSFLDRWLARDRKKTHNNALYGANTGSSYSKPMYSSSHGPYEKEYSSSYDPLKERTTPNLTNTPWRYYRRDSAGSAISTDSNGSTGSAS